MLVLIVVSEGPLAIFLLGFCPDVINSAGWTLKRPRNQLSDKLLENRLVKHDTTVSSINSRSYYQRTNQNTGFKITSFMCLHNGLRGILHAAMTLPDQTQRCLKRPPLNCIQPRRTPIKNAFIKMQRFANTTTTSSLLVY